jgi:hypothetical protein
MNTPLFFGKARVVGIEGPRLRLETPDRFPVAESTLAFGYTPTVGDVVVAIETPEGWFVIGVLDQKTSPRLSATGNMTFSTPAGKIRLKAGQELTLRSRSIALATGRLDRSTNTLIERLHTALHFVRNAFGLRARRLLERVETTASTHAENIRLAARETTIDAQTTNLS